MKEFLAVLKGDFVRLLPVADADFAQWLQWIGAAALLYLAVLGLTLAARAFRHGARLTRRGVAAQSLKTGKDHELLFLVAASVGGRGRACRKAVIEALENHLGAFVFGAARQVRPFPEALAPLAPDADPAARLRNIAHARRLMKQANADVFVWLAPRRGGRPGARLAVLASEDWTSERNPKPWEFEIAGRPEDWSLEAREAIAYVAARTVRPILARPLDYRPEKLSPIVERLAVMRESAHAFDRTTATLMNSDFASGALSIAERGLGQAWYERAYQARLAALAEIDAEKEPIPYAFGELELGRALAGMGVKSLDNVKLNQAGAHLRQALDLLRQNEVLSQAETAARSLQRIEQAIADSKRVFLRFPG